MRGVVASCLVVCSLTAWGCGSSSSGNPVAPPPTNTPPNNAVTVNVVADNGVQSFSPNPATLPAGQMVVWRNVDNVTHRVVLNNGSVDTGNLAPGASSRPVAVNTASAPYHCSIHPSMVGTLNAAQAAPPSSDY